MRIVPSSTNIGKLGSQENEEVIYDWKFYYSALSYLPWLAIPLVFGIIKDNRKAKALYILISLLIVNFIWILFKKISRMSSSEIEINLTFHCFAIGLALLWLIGHKLEKLHGILRFLL